jgi:hypothetical protein
VFRCSPKKSKSPTSNLKQRDDKVARTILGPNIKAKESGFPLSLFIAASTFIQIKTASHLKVVHMPLSCSTKKAIKLIILVRSHL